MKLDMVKVAIALNGSPCQEADVRRLRYVEGISELCEADITLALPVGNVGSLQPGAAAKITVSRGDDDSNVRQIHGIVQSIEHLDQGDGLNLARPLVRLRVVPRVWRSTLSKRTRTFLKSSYDDAIGQTLSELGLPRPSSASSVTHDFFAQYQESDFGFMSRLMEEAGALHIVQQQEREETWQVRAAAGFQGLNGSPRNLMWTTLASGESDDEGVTRAGRVGGLGVSSVKVTDVDRRLASQPEKTGTTKRKSELVFAVAEREALRIPGADATRHSAVIADEHQPSREHYWLETSDLQVYAGEALAAELSRGDAEQGVTTRLLVVRVEHEVETSADGAVYQNRVEATSLDAGFYPARVAPRPTIVAPQTGIVDSFNGRKDLEIAVIMDWGGEQPCVIPVRMTQPIAGSNHGAILVPAVGSEVLVHFIDGVPERPVFIGALYNASNKASWASATGDEEAMMGQPSIFKSRLGMIGKRGPTSTIEVDDAVQDSEKISMHAINDVDVVIDRHETTHTKGKLTEKVTGDVNVTLEAKRTTKVTSDETYETNGNVSITVHKAGRVLVNQTLQMTADTKLSLISGNTRADFSPSAAKITVGGAVIEMAAASIKLSVGASAIELSPASIKIASSASIDVLPAGVMIKGGVVDLKDGSLVVA